MHFNTFGKRQRLTYVRSVPTVAVRYYSNAQYEPFPSFLYLQGAVTRSEWRLDTRSNNHWKRWFLYKQTVRDPRVSDRCFRCDHRRQRRRFLGSLCSWQSRPTLCLCYERQRTATHPHPTQESFCTQQVVASLQGVGGHSPVLLTRHSMFVRETPNVRSIPRILDLSW